MINIKGQSPAEFFNWKKNPFADTYRIKIPYISKHEDLLLKYATMFLSCGKNFAV